MNTMSHTVPNTIGVEQDDLAKQLTSLVPGYMSTGGAMSNMQMNMPLPENTLPMMTGLGPHGDMEMGGMFTVMKIRANLARGDYRDPGWYQAPAGSVAYAWEGEPPPAERGAGAGAGAAPAAPAAPESAPFQVRKPSALMEH